MPRPPEGYEVNGVVYAVEVSAAQREELVDHTYLNITTYVMAVDGETSLMVAHDKVEEEPAVEPEPEPDPEPGPVPNGLLLQAIVPRMQQGSMCGQAWPNRRAGSRFLRLVTIPACLSRT